ncbi:MAG: hypothetical protein DHS80DRAFT_8321, partial [Piptocephalis tieghemiana]
IAGIIRSISSTNDQAQLNLLIREQLPAWKHARGDMFHWVPVLDHFDHLLSQFISTYHLGSPSKPTSPFSPSDRALLLSILEFTRLLVENCTNRNIYNSYEHLDALLWTLDPAILHATL